MSRRDPEGRASPVTPAPSGSSPDLADAAARLGAALREAGLPAGPGRCERFAAAVTLVRPPTARALYQCALATLTSSRDEADVLKAVLSGLLGRPADGADRADRADRADGDGRAHRPDRAATGGPDGPEAGLRRPRAGHDQGGAADPARQLADRYLGSQSERLASTDFAELTGAELAGLAAMMRQLTLAVPARRSRRQRRRPGGQRIDLRATLRQARRTGGHAFRLVGHQPTLRPRRLVVLCDISGSMEPYARAMIQLMYCAAGGASAEVFTFATRLTRLTGVLAGRLPDPALQRAGLAAPDWHGGTRIGSCLKEFNDRHGRRGLARGAVIVIISDGWDTGPPGLLASEMERLSLVAFRIVWVNPRTKSAGYQPLAGGMAAAWPHCDAVVSGHSLASLDQLAAALADPVRRRAAVRTPVQP